MSAGNDAPSPARHTARSLVRRVVRMEVAQAGELTILQALGGGFMALVPAPALVAAMVAQHAEAPIGGFEVIALALVIVLVFCISLYVGASVWGRFSARYTERAKAELDAEDTILGTNWRADAELNGYFRAKLRVGLTIMGVFAGVILLLSPFAALGFWLDAGGQ